MKAVAWTNIGIVDISVAELTLFSSTKPKLEGQLILFSAKDEIGLAKICYLSRSIRGVISLLGTCTISDLEKTLAKTKFPFDKDDTFAARVKLFNSSADSHELEVQVGAIVNDATGAVVDLKSPKFTVLVLVQGDKCFFGIDYATIDLGKRDYKLFSTRQSLKGNVAFSLCMIAGFAQKKTLLDPFARDGMIGIEAALFSIGKSTHFYQKEKLGFIKFLAPNFALWDKSVNQVSDIRLYDSLFHNISAIKKNAKIAGVDKAITVSRIDVEWVDLKLDDKSVDCIVSYPPLLTQHSDAKSVTKLYKELFHQAEFVLKKNGLMVLALHSLEVISSLQHSLKLVRQIDLYQGEERLLIVVFSKS